MNVRSALAGSRLGPLVRVARRRAKRAHAVARVQRLRRRGAVGKRTLIGHAPVVVSLTSHGKRVQDVSLAIESIGAGRVRPLRLILWLDDERIFAELPESLTKQMARGLEVRLTQNYGPHTKYFPYVRSVDSHRLPLVTADDDILYPRNWLARLLTAYVEQPELVSCYRANVVCLDGDHLALYRSWPRCKDTVASVTRFATGVSGVIYPPAMLDELSARNDAFRASCPQADDIWLHWVALRTSRPVRQISSTPRHFPVVPGSQSDTSLMKHNVGSGGNDEQIRALYTDADVRLLRRAASRVRST